MSHFKVKYKSAIFELSIDSERSIQDVFEYLSEVVDLNKLHCKLLLRGKSFAPDTGSAFAQVADVWPPGTIGLLLSSSQDEIDTVKRLKPDPLVKGFAEEARDEIRRIQRTAELENTNPWGSGSDQHSEFRFTRFEALFRRTRPSPYDAEKLLKKLATDPGIVDIMTSRKFVVGTLCELDPEDADIEQAEKGETDRCLLGWNRNFGERIALRLRTDDFTSFRKYHSIVNTLIHELTHNIVGPHNEKFWELFNELKRTYDTVHRSRANGKQLGSGLVAPVRSLDYTSLDESQTKDSLSARLGGSTEALTSNEMRAARLRRLESTQGSR